MNRLFTLKTRLCLLAGLAVTMAAPSPSTAQESGATVWARSCGRCHRIQPPTKYDARHWEAIVGHMALNARLTTDEEDAVREFLMGAARSVALDDSSAEPTEVAQFAAVDLAVIAASIAPDGATLFQQQCIACHGDTGVGDGPAAIAYNPKPADLTDPAVAEKWTSEGLLELLTDGKGSMPSFKALLSQEELEALAEYVQSLSTRADSDPQR